MNKKAKARFCVHCETIGSEILSLTPWTTIIPKPQLETEVEHLFICDKCMLLPIEDITTSIKSKYY